MQGNIATNLTLWNLFAGLVLLIWIGFFTAFSYRVWVVFISRRPRPHSRSWRKDPAHLCVILGSGGHTTEVLLMLDQLETYKYPFRHWIVGRGDAGSEARCIALENMMYGRIVAWGHKYKECCLITQVTRARDVHASLYRSIPTALKCVIDAFKALLAPRDRNGKYAAPDVVVANGPGTSAIIIYALAVLRLVDIWGSLGGFEKTRVVYVESWARVNNVSLTGRLVKPVVDRFFVQWEDLAKELRVEFRGTFV